VGGNNPHFLYRVNYIDTGGGVKTTAKQHLDAVAQERREKAGNNNDGGDGNRRGSVDYYKLLPDNKRSLYMKLRSARIAVSYDNNNWDTRFSIARDKDLYNIVMQDGDITVETIRNNNDVDSRVHPFAESLLNYFSMKDDELENLLKKYKAEMESKKRQAIEAKIKNRDFWRAESLPLIRDRDILMRWL
jgi:hypothetical protein